MPILNSTQAAVGGVCVILIYGIVIEKYYVSRSTVFYNILSFILLLASVDLPWHLLAGLVIYLILGVIIMKAHVKLLYPVFGARTYGSLALILILYGNDYLPLFEGRSLLETYLILMLIWTAVALFVNLLGHLYKKWS